MENKRNAAIIIICSLVLIIAIFALGLFESASTYFFSNKDNNPKGELLKVVLTVLGGVGAIWGLSLNSRKTKALEEQTIASQKQIDNTQLQIDALLYQNKIVEKGKIDERFKNAIEHLGDSRAAIVLGGIHSLHRIAQEDESYREPVFNILCSYIRETTKNAEYQKENKKMPSIVIQTIIDTIFKSKKDDKFIYKGLIAYLMFSYLAGANFRSANLVKAEMYSTQLQFAKFGGANMQGIYLAYSNLQFARFHRTQLQGSCLDMVKMHGIYAFKMQLQGASLNKTQLQGVNFESAMFQGAKLRETNLQGSSARYSNFDSIISSTTRKSSLVGVNADVSGITQGKLNKDEGELIINYIKDFFSEDSDQTIIESYSNIILKATENDTQINDSTNTFGALSKDDLDKILNDYKEVTGEDMY